MKKLLRYLSLGLLSTILTATPGLGAERISFFYPPFGEFSLSTDSLEIFAKEGKINDELAFYADRATPQQLAQLRDLLQQRFQVTPTLVSQFTYSPLGEEVVRRLGELILTDSRQNGFYAIRGALIVAAADPQGLTVLNFLRRFPSQSLRLNFSAGLQIVKNLSDLLKTRDAVVGLIQQQASAQAANANVDFSQKVDLRQPGIFSPQKISFTLDDRSRDRSLPVDVYLPQVAAKTSQNSPVPPFPLIVISHGIASDRYAFVYLANHLASYGFAVVVLEHPGSNAKRFQQYFAGLAGSPEPMEFINRPMDVKYVLDELERLDKSNPDLKGKLNFQQVAAIGHSYGGYTVLALAGAKINFEKIYRDCNPNRSLNVSVLLQCGANDLPRKDYQLQDDRIKAIIAINPIDSTIFGESGLRQIQVPTMLVAASQDIFAPSVPEQIQPFTWLSSPNKYLVLLENATHFTAIAEPTPENDVLPVPGALLGPVRTAGYSYLQALSVAFLQTHLLNRPEYRPYLQPSYAKYISQEPLNLSLLQSLTPDQLTQVLNGSTPQSAAPASP
ncbi:MAG: alpha/beta hydrolase [Gloeotrichia echinulata IR180]|jgi:predicted dienelactone hydrolase|nr:alpha/beta hydrolase [Gloeotrichia echinulata DEX184]